MSLVGKKVLIVDDVSNYGREGHVGTVIGECGNLLDVRFNEEDDSECYEFEYVNVELWAGELSFPIIVDVIEEEAERLRNYLELEIPDFQRRVAKRNLYFCEAMVDKAVAISGFFPPPKKEEKNENKD